MHRTNWDDLRYVLAVAEAGSVAAAARELRVNHATVLRRIALFEETHGVTVFEKASTGYSVSPEARNIITAIREADHAVFAVERLAREGSRTVLGDVRITSTDTLCAFIIPQIIAQARRVEPDIRFELLSSNSYAELPRSVADIAIRPTLSLPNDMFGQSAGVLSFGVYCQAGLYADALPWLGLRGDLTRSSPALWMAKNVLETEVSATADSFLTLCEMALAGVGKTFLPSFVAARYPDLKRVKQLDDMTVDLWVASHQSLTNTPRISRVRDLLAQLLSEHSELTGKL